MPRVPSGRLEHVGRVLPDLPAEGDELGAPVPARPDRTGHTPAAGWPVTHQIARLGPDARSWPETGRVLLRRTGGVSFPRVLA